MGKKIISALIALTMVLSMFAFIGAYAAEEVLFRITFEKDVEEYDPWSKAGKDMSSFATDCYTEGKRSLLVNDDSEKSTGLRGKKVFVKEGETYTALADCYLVSGDVYFYLRYYDAAGNQLSNNNAKGTPGKWVTLAISTAAPKTAATAELIIATMGGGKGTAYFDNLRLVKGSVPAGTPTGKNPANIPTQAAPTPSAPAVDDGIKEGTVIYSTSFEDGLGKWSYWGKAEGNVTLVTDPVSDGKKAFHVVDPEESGSPGLQSELIPVTAGSSYSFSIDAKVVSGTTKMFVRFYDAGGTQLSHNAITFSGSDYSEQIYVGTAPANTKSAQVIICGMNSTMGDAYVDNFKVTKGKAAPVVKNKSFIAPKQVAPVDAKLVAPVNNKLQYNTYNDKGDKLGDFSTAGFYQGQYNLPVTANLPVAMELSPSGEKDDTSMIQAAIDKVYNESSDSTFKVIKLKAGKYNIGKKGITLKSGIILSGEGQGPTGTELYAYEAAQYSVVRISGNAPVLGSFKADITDDYVNAGSRKINISAEDAKSFKVGDLIAVTHPATDEWAKAVEMTGIVNTKGQDSSWGKNNQNMVTERVITAINGTEITLDTSIFIPLMKNLSQSYIQKVADSGRGENIGIENLRIVSYYNGDPSDEQHATVAIHVSNAKNVFARDITAKHFYGSLISSSKKAKNVTALNCSSIEPISKVTGSRRYTFATSTSAQHILYVGCYSSKGRHDYETSFEVTGPIVFLDSVADESYGGVETHGTWATGILYDNVYSVANDTVASIGFKNHGVYGGGESQGWSAATAVAWNCLAPAIIVHRPPEPYQNFMVGSWGIYKDPAGQAAKKTNITRYIPIYRTTSHSSADKDIHFATKDGSPFVGDGFAEAEFTPVEPRSLFKAQLSERFTGTILNARPNAPIIINPKYDKTVSDKKITVDGICQLGATKVTVYIDDVAYDAPIAADNSFKATIELKEGVHKIYATQTIGGNEGTKTPDRFITIGKADGNPAYLQSVYDISKTTLLLNDPRPTYDVYEKGIKGELADKITVLVNGTELVSDVEPFETNGRVLVPMRAIFEALKAEVLWDEATVTATAKKDGTEVKITENKTTTYVNGKPYELDVPATIVNGRFVVPVRFISESFGAKVDWIDARKTVVIESGGIKYPAMHGLDGELDVADLIQSGDDGAGAVIQNVTDNDYSTKWGVGYDESKPDGAYGIFDMGEAVKIGSMHIAFSAGNKRVYTVDIYSSNDGKTYTPVKIGHKSTGTTAQFEEIPLNIEARYIKLVGKGNSVNHWLNLQEVAFTK